MFVHCRESVIRCVEEDDVCQPSQRHTAVELLNLVLEELLQLWSLCLQCWRQEAILNREHLVMEVDVLHLEEEQKGFWKIPHFYTNEDKKKMKLEASFYLPAQMSEGHWLCPDAPNLPELPSLNSVDIH